MRAWLVNWAASQSCHLARRCSAPECISSASLRSFMAITLLSHVVQMTQSMSCYSKTDLLLTNWCNGRPVTTTTDPKTELREQAFMQSQGGGGNLSIGTDGGMSSRWGTKKNILPGGAPMSLGKKDTVTWVTSLNCQMLMGFTSVRMIPENLTKRKYIITSGTTWLFVLQMKALYCYVSLCHIRSLGPSSLPSEARPTH